MYALVTSDGYALTVVDGPLDEAYAEARALGAHEVIFDESYDLSELFTEQIEQLQRAANPAKRLKVVEEPRPKPTLRARRLEIIPDPERFSPAAMKAIDAYMRTGKFPKGISRAVAVEILRHAGPAARLQAAALFEEPDPAKAPNASWVAANKIRIELDDVLKMPVPDAFEAVRKLAVERVEEGSGFVSPKTGKLWDRYQEGGWRLFLRPAGRDPETGLPTGMGFLGNNHKLAKGSPVGAVDVMGLQLLPHKLWQLGFEGENPGRGIVNTCIGASPECAQACLVYSGQNTNKANDIKAWRTDCFVREPVAFARLLLASIDVFKGGARGFQQPRWDGYVPFVRLNVLSDLPWEIVFPELFDFYKDLSFYDYTKVPGRKPPPNYDLTFSWSGMNAKNSDWAWKNLGKVTMVFFKSPQPGGRWPTHEYWRGRLEKRMGVPPGPMPESFMGMEVIDGDITDVRPYDERLAKTPMPWVIGLRYKPPKSQAFDKARSLFIVPVEEHEGTIFAAVVPRDQPGVMESQLAEAADIMRLRRAEEAFVRWAKEHGEPVSLPGERPLNPGKGALRRRLLR